MKQNNASIKFLSWWSVLLPCLSAAIAFYIHWISSSELNTANTILVSLFLFASVFAAVHHAEVIAQKSGEPFGTLILAIAVTIIEVALIISLMLSGKGNTASLARDTVFATIMIVLNCIIGLCLLLGAAKHHEQAFGIFGTNAALSSLTTLSVFTLILPNYTTSEKGPIYSSSQLLFVGVISLILYLTFVMVQTIRHRNYFLPTQATDNQITTQIVPTTIQTINSSILLFISLISIVLLAKALSHPLENIMTSFGLPKSLVAILIAGVVLLPEGTSAIKAAKHNNLQTSLNLALGSALATIGLTIPVVSFFSVYYQMPLILGLDHKSIVLLILSLLISILSFGTGKTTVLQGAIHLLIFAVYMLLSMIP